MPRQHDDFFGDRPLIVAHRGASDVAPENTLPAFEAAIEARADAIELDVTRCASGELIVIHDDTVDRTTNGSGRVDTMSYLILRELDAGCWFGEAYRGQRLPLLSEVLDLVAGRAKLNIELKSRRARDGELVVAVAELVQARGIEDQVLISSFNPWALWRMKSVAPHVPCGVLYAAEMPFYLARAWARHVIPLSAMHPQHTMVDEAYMAFAHRAGYRVLAWTVDDAPAMQRLISLGVDGIITNRPARLRELVGE